MISLLVVNYHSAALAAEAVRTARAASTQPLQVVAVDNSVEPREASALRTVADVVVVSESNRGYAGGINLGRRACEGETIIVTNPDVMFGNGAIDKLNGELRAGVAVAGPALFWDDAYSWLLPPGDRQSTMEKADEVLAGRSRAWRDHRDRRRFRRRIAFWSLRETTEVSMLSGAVMAIRAADFDDLGGFDERFPLYFEETDFLRRVIERRKKIVYVPAARCRHIYNQSAGDVADYAAASYATSEMRYLEKWSGPFMARLLKRLERPIATPAAALMSGGAQEPVGAANVTNDDVITEASPSPAFPTAAGHFGRAALPEEIRKALKTEFYLRTVVRGTGEVLATVKISP